MLLPANKTNIQLRKVCRDDMHHYDLLKFLTLNPNPTLSVDLTNYGGAKNKEHVFSAAQLRETASPLHTYSKYNS